MATTKPIRKKVARRRATRRKPDRAWFEQQLEARGMIQAAFAKLMNMDPSVMSRLLGGTRLLKADEAAAVARVFGVPLDEVYLRFGMDPPAQTEGAKVVGTLDDSRVLRPGVPRGAPKSVPLPKGMPDGTQAALLQTRDAQDGWIVYFNPITAPLLESVGRWCIATLEDGAQVLCVLRPGYTPGTWNIESTVDRDAKTSVKVTSASPIQWIRT